MRGFFRFAFLGWFITSYPRTSKAIVILAALALLIGIYMSAVKRLRSFSISAFFPEVKPAHAAFQSYVSKASEMDIAVSRGVADLRARPGVKGKRITELRRCIMPKVWASLICLALIQLEKVAVRAGRGYFRSWVGYCAGRK